MKTTSFARYDIRAKDKLLVVDQFLSKGFEGLFCDEEFYNSYCNRCNIKTQESYVADIYTLLSLTDDSDKTIEQKLHSGYTNLCDIAFKNGCYNKEQNTVIVYLTPLEKEAFEGILTKSTTKMKDPIINSTQTLTFNGQQYTVSTSVSIIDKQMRDNWRETDLFLKEASADMISSAEQVYFITTVLNNELKKLNMPAGHVKTTLKNLILNVWQILAPMQYNQEQLPSFNKIVDNISNQIYPNLEIRAQKPTDNDTKYPLNVTYMDDSDTEYKIFFVPESIMSQYANLQPKEAQKLFKRSLLLRVFTEYFNEVSSGVDTSTEIPYMTSSNRIVYPIIGSIIENYGNLLNIGLSTEQEAKNYWLWALSTTRTAYREGLYDTFSDVHIPSKLKKAKAIDSSDLLIYGNSDSSLVITIDTGSFIIDAANLPQLLNISGLHIDRNSKELLNSENNPVSKTILTGAISPKDGNKLNITQSNQGNR